MSLQLKTGFREKKNTFKVLILHIQFPNGFNDHILIVQQQKKAEIMEMKNKEYSITYDANTNTIHCTGIIRLRDKEYIPFMQWLNKLIEAEPAQITLNLRELQALNSAGVAMFGKFVFAVEKKKTIQLVLQGNAQITWQKKLGKNFQRLMSKLQVELE